MSAITHEIDLSVLPEGKTYEDQYSGYLKVFEEISNIAPSVEIVVKNAPWSWVPLLHHLSCACHEPRIVFKHCPMVRDATRFGWVPDRTALEVLCCFRPETVDALYKVDQEWKPSRAKKYVQEKDFIITTNGGFYRQEILDYIRKLKHYKPPQLGALIVPCAADKPYPAPLHKAVLEIMPKDFYLITATGALGLVPQELWPIMPHYDAGIPNQWRMMNITCHYFGEKLHRCVVVYCDFQNMALYTAFKNLGMTDYVHFINDPSDKYIDLMNKEGLMKLKKCLDYLTLTDLEGYNENIQVQGNGGLGSIYGMDEGREDQSEEVYTVSEEEQEMD